MATVIRLKRGGRKHVPYYRIVVTDSRNRARGRVIDQIGFYHPCARPMPMVEVDTDKAMDWLRKGACPTETVRTVLSKKGLLAAKTGKLPETEGPPAAEEPTPEPAPETAPE